MPWPSCPPFVVTDAGSELMTTFVGVTAEQARLVGSAVQIVTFEVLASVLLSIAATAWTANTATRVEQATAPMFIGAVAAAVSTSVDSLPRVQATLPLAEPLKTAPIRPEPSQEPQGHAPKPRVLESVERGMGVSTSRRVWATQLGIARSTLDKAIAELADEGLIRVHASKGRGTSVRLAGEGIEVATRH